MKLAATKFLTRRRINQLAVLVAAFLLGCVATQIWRHRAINRSLFVAQQDPLWAKPVFIEGEFSPADIAQIRALIEKKTSSRILSITQRLNGTQVDTGSVNGPLDGFGVRYVVKKNGTTWEIVNESTWVS